PHARVETDAGGRLRVGGASLFRGYWGAADVDGGSLWPTEDAGAFVDGSLVVLGRLDAVIISGGKKIAPEEIEAAALESGAAEDAAALGVPDAEWGERLVLCFPAGRGDAAALKAFFETRLEGWKRPKKIIALSSWPRDAKGKLNRRELRAALPPEDLAGTFS
ncbi:MAG: hypothetical protein LBR12_05155, partial [Opitutaceae bacterium]|nr:hypothetical protein [Opitutaceae bacterium]